MIQIMKGFIDLNFIFIDLSHQPSFSYYMI